MKVCACCCWLASVSFPCMRGHCECVCTSDSDLTGLTGGVGAHMCVRNRVAPSPSLLSPALLSCVQLVYKNQVLLMGLFR
jgi:hypothetical protein